MTLELALLVTLNQTHPRLMPEGALRNDAIAECGKLVTVSECRTVLRKLEEEGYVTGVTNQDTGTKYHITDAGRVRVAEAMQ